MRNLRIAIAGALLLASCGGGAATSDDSARDDSGDIVEGGDVGVFVVQEGDCISWPTNGDPISSFDGSSCDDPHDGEIYSLFDVTGFDDFPGGEIIAEQANQGCLAAFEPYVGIAYQQSEFFFTFLGPSEETWDLVDDREVICIATPAEGEPQLTMSLEGIAR